VTETYTVKVADNNGGFATQNVTITITGSNEAPGITSTAQTGAGTEDTNIDNSGNLNAGGTIAFTDGNLTDTHTVSASASTLAWAGGTLTAAQQAALTAASTFTPTLTHDATGGSTGTVGWTFSVSDNAVDFLAAGQTLTRTYTVQVADNNGGSTTQDVTITITGTNEAPVIGVAQLTGSVTEDLQGHETGSET